MKIVKVNNKLKSKGMKIFFIAIYFIITFIGLLCIFRVPKYTSEYENRSLAHFKKVLKVL